MNGYINIHTHHRHTGAGFELLSFYKDFELAEKELPCSAGLHPWHLDAATLDEDLERLRPLLALPQVWAIGECGLDKITATPWATQLKAFRAQIIFANQLNKPLIIHCVRAFEELLAVFRETPATVPVIVHGFNKKPAIATKLLDAGFYLSFGKALLESDTARASFLQTPADRFFLETDDADISITAVYKAAAETWKTAEETIISHAQNNFNKIFRS